jgi:hypothetical protein
VLAPRGTPVTKSISLVEADTVAQALSAALE